MKKNVLIISDSYPPLNVAGAQRPYALAKYLDKTKYCVSVITWPNPITYHGINQDFDPELENVKIINIKSKVGGNRTKIITENVKTNTSIQAQIKKYIISILMKFIFPDKGMFWLPDVKHYLNKNEELIKNTDFIFSTSPAVSNHRIARYIKRKNKKIKWIADFRDFNYVEHWEHKSGLKASLHKRLEKSIISDSDHLTFVTKTMQNAYQKFYPNHQAKMHCMYNGFEKSDFPEMGEKEFTKPKISFFYAGSFYNGLRSPIPLMQLLDRAFEKNLISKNEVEIQIAGNVEDEMKESMKKFQSADCVNFLGSIPRTDVIKYMAGATFLWLIVANIKAHYQTIPIKIFEYIAARRPIVNFAPAESESSQIIEKNNLGFCFDTFEFDLEKNYLEFEKMIVAFKEGEYKIPMPKENLDAFVWESQIKLIENIL